MKNERAPFCLLYIFINVLFQIHSQKFFRHHYEVIFERANINYLNNTIASANASVAAYNRTTRPLNFKFKLLRDIQEDSTVSFSAYQFKSNEYRLTAIQFSMKIKTALKIDVAGFDALIKGASPPIEWPLQRGVTYTVKNFMPDNNNMPFPFAPVGRWKDIITFYGDNRVTKAFEFSVLQEYYNSRPGVYATQTANADYSIFLLL